MHKSARIALGAVAAAAFLAMAPRAQAAMAADEDFRCVDISTTEVGCCLFDESGNATKCFKINLQ